MVAESSGWPGLVHRCAAAVFLLAAAPLPADAASLPLWEVGLLLGVASLPDYPASNERQTVVLPLPYLVFRGPVFRSDEKGLLRGRVFRSARVELDVSFSGSIPVRSNGNAARIGMPDLHWIGEVGPRLEVEIMRHGPVALQLDLPIRAVATTDFKRADYIGLLAAPALVFLNDDVDGRGTQLQLSAAALVADQKVQSLYFGVDPAYATATRPEYRAQAGYLGARFRTSLSRRYTDRFHASATVGYDDYRGSKNRASPLFAQDHTWMAGLTLSWSLAISKQRVAE